MLLLLTADLIPSKFFCNQILLYIIRWGTHYHSWTWLQDPITITHSNGRHIWGGGHRNHPFLRTWNATQIFPDLQPQQLSKANQSLNKYGFTLLMPLTSPITLSLKTPTNPFQILSLTFSQIQLIVSLLNSLVLLFHFYITNCIHCIVKRFMPNFNYCAHSFNPFSTFLICAQSTWQHEYDEHTTAVK